MELIVHEDIKISFLCDIYDVCLFVQGGGRNPVHGDEVVGPDMAAWSQLGSLGKLSQVWWHKSVISSSGEQGKRIKKFEASLDCISEILFQTGKENDTLAYLILYNGN